MSEEKAVVYSSIQGRPGARIRNAHKGTSEALKSELGKVLDLTSGFREGARELCSEAWMEKVWVGQSLGSKSLGCPKAWIQGSSEFRAWILTLESGVEKLRKAWEYQCFFFCFLSSRGWPGNRLANSIG